MACHSGCSSPGRLRRANGVRGVRCRGHERRCRANDRELTDEVDVCVHGDDVRGRVDTHGGAQDTTESVLPSSARIPATLPAAGEPVWSDWSHVRSLTPGAAVRDHSQQYGGSCRRTIIQAARATGESANP
jgi:hypothetical protein